MNKHLRRLKRQEEDVATDIRAHQELELPVYGPYAHKAIWECMHGPAPNMTAYTLRAHLRNVYIFLPFSMLNGEADASCTTQT
jgi:hypothetical protein